MYLCVIYIYICDLFIHAYRYTHTYVVVYKYKIYICIHIQKGTITISGGGGDHQTLGHICAYLFIQSCVYFFLYLKWSSANRKPTWIALGHKPLLEAHQAAVVSSTDTATKYC